MPANGNLSGVRKAAILTLHLGEEGANQLLQSMSQEELERVAREIATLGTIQPADSEQVLVEFHAGTVAGAGGTASGGIESVHRLLQRALGEDAARPIIDRVSKSARSTAGFTSLTLSDPHQLSKFVQAEQPQTIALILAHLDGMHAAQLVSLLPDDLRSDVVTRMANLDEISPEVVDQISSVIDRRLKSLGGSSHEAYGGVRAVAGLLNRLERVVSDAVLEQVELHSPDLAVSIRNLMFVFEDLGQVGNAALRELISRADRKVLTVALRGASEGLQASFFENMSQRAVLVFREEMEVLGSVRLRDVTKAQQEIVTIARKLEEEGLLTTGGTAGEEFIA